MPPTPDHTEALRTDGARWDALVHRYAGLVWSIPRAHGFAVGTSSEVAQTTWLRLVEQVDDIAPPAIGAWLVSAARQESARAARWHDGERSAPSDPLLTAVGELPARVRVALRVSAVEPLPSEQELAAALDLAPELLEATTTQGLQRLAAAVDPSVDAASLMARLRAAVRESDAPPPALLAAARAAFSWRTLDAELAPLADEPARDDTLVGVRGVPGVRRLAFRAGGLAVDLEVSVAGVSMSMLGQLTPAGPAAVVLRLVDGSARDVAVDDLGRFAIDDIPAGQVSLRVVSPAADRPLHTDWVML